MSTLLKLNPAAAFGSPAARLTAVMCNDSKESFVDKFFNQSVIPDTLRASAVNFKCPLMRLFALQCVGDDYTGDNAPYFCFGRIDDICKVVGLPTLALTSELQRASLAATLVPIYAPFDEYMRTDAELSSSVFHRQRNGRFLSSIYWYVLHKFLCEEAVELSDGAFQRLADRVTLFIELCKADPGSFSRYEDTFYQYYREGVNIYFDKYNSFTSRSLFPNTEAKYDEKWTYYDSIYGDT
jgi:hypothetical protein